MIHGTLELNQYVTGVQQGNYKDFPEYLRLPEEILDTAVTLFNQGEAAGVEMGYNLSYGAKAKLEYGPLTTGTKTGINFVHDADKANFGDLHTHPASSLGYVNGYLAHSNEDLIYFKNQLKKPVFIRLVVSGNCLYGMIYLNGVSNFDANEIDKSRDKRKQDMTDFFFKHNKTITSQEKYDDLYSEVAVAADSRIAGAVQADWEKACCELWRKTPGYGTYCQWLSVDVCKQIAAHCNFGFYVRKKSKVYESGRLELQ